MTRTARLSADLVANTTGFESSLKRASRSVNTAQRSWNNDLNRAGRSFRRFDGEVRQSLGSIIDLRAQLGGIAVATASALSVNKIIRYSDTWRELEGRLKVAAGEMENIKVVQKQLFEIAQNNAAPLRDVVDAYSRMSLALNDAQKAETDLIKVTELLSKTLLVSGTNAAGAATFFQQFGQAASSDFKAVGQEIQTFQDQNAFFVKILQENLDLGGRSLKQFAADGDLSFKKLADAVIAGSDKINAAADEVPNTVGRALQKLDNAFLQFIGQTNAIRSGTSSLAVAINSLADNFGTLATAVTGLAVVVGARLVTSLALAGKQMLLTAFGTLRLQVVLASMGGVAASSAVSLLALSGALRAVAGGIALLGGPLGVAAIGTFLLMKDATKGAKDAQVALNNALADHRGFVNEYITADDERRRVIEENTKANIQAYKNELIALEKIAVALENENALLRLSRNLGSKLGIDTSASDVREVADNVRTAIDQLENDLKFFEKGKRDGFGTTGGGSGSGTGKGKKDVAKDIINDLKKESEQLEIQIDMYGRKEAAIDKAQKAAQIRNKLEEQGIKLTEKQSQMIDEYLEKIEKQTELQNEQAEQQKRLEEQERNRREALDQLGATFESAFEKAITDGEKLSDVLNGLLDDILKLLTRVTITEPLGNAITDIFGGVSGGIGRTPDFNPNAGGSSGGGILSGIGSFVGNLFSGITPFATGTNYVPKDMIAQIHKGEMIVPAYDAAKLRNGGTGGNVNVIINNNAGAEVSTSSQETGDGTQLNIMIDQAVADNINKKGTRTNAAITGQLNKTRIRR